MPDGHPSRSGSSRRDRHVLLVAATVVVQSVAAVFFVADAAGDIAEAGASVHVAVEALVAVALVAGVVLGAWHARLLMLEARRAESARAIASGALGGHIVVRFGDWGLTEAEADVALFAIKGCDAAEIARLRGASPGTVRAQLSRVYAKAGVTSRASLVSLFIDDLLGPVDDRAAPIQLSQHGHEAVGADQNTGS